MDEVAVLDSLRRAQEENRILKNKIKKEKANQKEINGLKLKISSCKLEIKNSLDDFLKEQERIKSEMVVTKDDFENPNIENDSDLQLTLSGLSLAIEDLGIRENDLKEIEEIIQVSFAKGFQIDQEILETEKDISVYRAKTAIFSEYPSYKNILLHVHDLESKINLLLFQEHQFSFENHINSMLNQKLIEASKTLDRIKIEAAENDLILAQKQEILPELKKSLEETELNAKMASSQLQIEKDDLKKLMQPYFKERPGLLKRIANLSHEINKLENQREDSLVLGEHLYRINSEEITRIRQAIQNEREKKFLKQELDPNLPDLTNQLTAAYVEFQRAREQLDDLLKKEAKLHNIFFKKIIVIEELQGMVQPEVGMQRLRELYRSATLINKKFQIAIIKEKHTLPND